MRHVELRNLLYQMYPATPIREEMPIRISGKTLYIDLFVDYPFRIAFEVQGEQHERFIGHFHRTEQGFRDALRRDRLKETWCAEHHIPLVYLWPKEPITEENIRRKIEEAERLVDQEFGDV